MKATLPLQMAGVFIALLGLIWALFTWWVPSPRNAPFSVFIRDVSGLPKSNVALVGGPEGDKKFPDASGMVIVPAKWDQSIVSVCEQGSWREIMKVKLERSEIISTTITVP